MINSPQNQQSSTIWHVDICWIHHNHQQSSMWRFAGSTTASTILVNPVHGGLLGPPQHSQSETWRCTGSITTFTSINNLVNGDLLDPQQDPQFNSQLFPVHWDVLVGLQHQNIIHNPLRWAVLDSPQEPKSSAVCCVEIVWIYNRIYIQQFGTLRYGGSTTTPTLQYVGMWKVNTSIRSCSQPGAWNCPKQHPPSSKFGRV